MLELDFKKKKILSGLKINKRNGKLNYTYKFYWKKGDYIFKFCFFTVNILICCSINIIIQIYFNIRIYYI